MTFCENCSLKCIASGCECKCHNLICRYSGCDEYALSTGYCPVHTKMGGTKSKIGGE